MPRLFVITYISLKPNLTFYSLTDEIQYNAGVIA